MEKGDRIAMIGRGLGLVMSVNDAHAEVRMPNGSYALLSRRDIAWSRTNSRWETDTVAFERGSRCQVAESVPAIKAVEAPLPEVQRAPEPWVQEEYPEPEILDEPEMPVPQNLLSDSLHELFP